MGIYYSIVNASPYALDPNPYRYLETPGIMIGMLIGVPKPI